MLYALRVAASLLGQHCAFGLVASCCASQRRGWSKFRLGLARCTGLVLQAIFGVMYPLSLWLAKVRILSSLSLTLLIYPLSGKPSKVSFVVVVYHHRWHHLDFLVISLLTRSLPAPPPPSRDYYLVGTSRQSLEFSLSPMTL